MTKSIAGKGPSARASQADLLLQAPLPNERANRMIARHKTLDFNFYALQAVLVNDAPAGLQTIQSSASTTA